MSTNIPPQISVYYDNIVSFNKYINLIIKDVESGDYDLTQLKLLSNAIETYYNDIAELPENQSYPEQPNKKYDPYEALSVSSNLSIEFSSDGEDNESTGIPAGLDEFFTQKPHKNKSKNSEATDEHSVNFIDSGDLPSTYEQLGIDSSFEKYQKLYQDYKQSLPQTNTHNTENKVKDKLVDSFLNNNLNVSDYYYLQMINNTRIEQYMNTSYTY